MSVRQLFIFILFVGFFAFSLRPPVDPDMWWHLKTGEYILENGIPYQDPPFSFTAVDNEWITHEWLTEIGMIGVYRLGGLAGLAIFFAAVVTGSFYLLYRVSDGRPYTAGFVTMWGVTAALPFLGTRPQMINLLGGAAVIFIVEQVRAGRIAARWLWSIPLLIVLWVNMHGGYLLGLAIIGVYLVGDGLQHFFFTDQYDGFSWSEWGVLAGVAVAGTFAALINPFGIQMWTYAYETTLTSEAMQTYITEWRSPDFQLTYFWFFGLMMIATWVAIAYSRRPVTITDLLFIIGTSYAALSSMRNIPIFVLVAIPIMSRHVVGSLETTVWYPTISGKRPETPPAPRIKIINGVLAAILCLAAAVYAINELQSISEAVEENFPVAAVQFIEENNLERIYNEYAWGGYLIWRGIPTFIDGRADLFGDEFIHLYMQAFRQQPSWQEPLDIYDVNYVLIRFESGLDTLLNASPDWQPIYQDEMAIIYQRQSP